MTQRDIIAIGASAGGFRVIRTLLRDLPADLPAAVLVTIHLSPEASPDILASLSGAGSPLPVSFARDGEPIRRGQVYVAPPDRHLLVDGDHLLVRHGPLENSSRPAIDPMLRSVAYHFRGRAVGLLLTGYLDDGVSGLIALRRCGGLVIVQDPQEAEVPEMPRHAMARAEPHHVVPSTAMAALLRDIMGGPAGPMVSPPRELELEVRIAARHESGFDVVEQLGAPSSYSCPDCHGNLREIRENDRVRYRCHTGHAYSLSALADAQDEELERALFSALRALEERTQLLHRLSRDNGTMGRNRFATDFSRRAQNYESQAAVIRNFLVNRQSPAGDSGEKQANIRPAARGALGEGRER